MTPTQLQDGNSRIPSLYVHFPFCEAKCHYCDFYSIGEANTRKEDPIQFEGALLCEAQKEGSRLAPTLETIFFGGGTPSLTPPETMAKLMATLESFSSISTHTEWTMEANPSSVASERMKAFRELGINRISMGVQSLNDDLLKRLGRVHTRDTALKALDRLFTVGFRNVSVDLICGIPGQSIDVLLADLHTLLQFPIQHLSCYLLTLPPHHPLSKAMPDENIQVEHLMAVHNRMTEAGFEHYEISNYCRPGFQARHNLRYWSGSGYLGLGPSAHSFDPRTNQRWKNVSSLHKYASLLQKGASPIEWTETLTDEQKRLEAWMLSLRTQDGFPDEWLSHPVQRNRCFDLVQRGLLEQHPTQKDRWRLTALGYPLSDPIISALALPN